MKTPELQFNALLDHIFKENCKFKVYKSAMWMCDEETFAFTELITFSFYKANLWTAPATIQESICDVQFHCIDNTKKTLTLHIAKTNYSHSYIVDDEYYKTFMDLCEKIRTKQWGRE